MPNQFNADDLNPDAAPVEPEANQPQPDQQAGLQEDATAWRLLQRHPELRQAFGQNVSQTQTQAGASGLVNGEEPDEDAPFIEKLEPEAFPGVRGIVKKELVEIKRELEAARGYKGHIDYLIPDSGRQR